MLFNADKTEFLKYPAAKGDKTYEIPEGVTIIKTEAFQNCNTLESVVIPEGVTSIEISAFYRCLALESVTIPTSVTSIGTLAFSFCSALKTVDYAGTDEDWDAIEIGEGNDYLIRAKTGEFPEQPDVPEVTEPVIFTPVIDAEELAKLDDDTKAVLQGITVTDSTGAFDEGVVMNVSFIEKTDGEFTFDITFTKNGAEVQPGDYVTVKIPIPEYLKGGNIYVYHYDDDGKPTRISYTIEDGCVVFATRSFSKYSLTNKLISSPSTPSSSTVIVPAPSTDSETGTNSDTGSDANSDTDTNANSDTRPDAGTDTGSPVSGGTGNPNTGIALAAVPMILAAGAVIVASKRKK